MWYHLQQRASKRYLQFGRSWLASKLRELLVIAEEDLDGQPGVAANLEAVGTAAELLHLVVGQRPTVKLEVGLDSGCGDGLGDDRGTALETPHETVFAMLARVQVNSRKPSKTYRT